MPYVIGDVVHDSSGRPHYVEGGHCQTCGCQQEYPCLRRGCPHCDSKDAEVARRKLYEQFDREDRRKTVKGIDPGDVVMADLGINPEHEGRWFNCGRCRKEFASSLACYNHWLSCEEATVEPGIVPTHPSNRAFYDKLIEWGCSPGKQRGDEVRMRLPDGDVLWVRKPNTHVGNGWDVFTTAYKSLCDGDAEVFWAGPTVPEPAPEEPKPNPNLIMLEHVQRAAEERKRQTYINRIFDYLVENPEAQSTTKIAQALGLDRQQVNQAAWRMAEQGVIERVKTGVYRIMPEHPAPDSQHQVDINVNGPAQAPPAPSQTAVDARLESVRESVPAPQHVDEDIEDLMGVVLDLLFPHGIRGSHLKVINQWQEVTTALIMKVRGESGR